MKFQKGQGGRPKGSKNRATVVLKEAVLRAAAAEGSDGKGKGELVGYLRRVARDDVKAFASLLGRVLPLQVTGEDGAPLIPAGAVLQFSLTQLPDSENRT